MKLYAVFLVVVAVLANASEVPEDSSPHHGHHQNFEHHEHHRHHVSICRLMHPGGVFSTIVNCEQLSSYGEGDFYPYDPSTAASGGANEGDDVAHHVHHRVTLCGVIHPDVPDSTVVDCSQLFTLYGAGEFYPDSPSVPKVGDIVEENLVAAEVLPEAPEAFAEDVQPEAVPDAPEAYAEDVQSFPPAEVVTDAYAEDVASHFHHSGSHDPHPPTEAEVVPDAPEAYAEDVQSFPAAEVVPEAPEAYAEDVQSFPPAEVVPEAYAEDVASHFHHSGSRDPHPPTETSEVVPDAPETYAEDAPATSAEDVHSLHHDSDAHHNHNQQHPHHRHHDVQPICRVMRPGGIFSTVVDCSQLSTYGGGDFYPDVPSLATDMVGNSNDGAATHHHVHHDVPICRVVHSGTPFSMVVDCSQLSSYGGGVFFPDVVNIMESNDVEESEGNVELEKPDGGRRRKRRKM